MNIELPLPYAERYLSTIEQRDAFNAFATITFLASKNPGERRVRYFDERTGERVMRTSRFYLEHLSPTQYHDTFARCVELNHRDIESGSPAPPLNERAHLSALVIDLDEGNHTAHETTCIGRLFQHALALHFGVRTRFLLAMRFCEDGSSRYHLHFPDVVMADMAVWYALLRIAADVARRFKFDKAPTSNRCIRVHGTNRDEGRSEPSGVYRFVVGYDVDMRRMGQEPHSLSAYSVRPSADALLAWMLRTGEYAQARTEVAREAYRALPENEGAGAQLLRSVFEGATADLRRTDLVQHDRSGRWFLAEGKVHRCAACDDNCRVRVLCRLAFTSVDGADTCTAYRWFTCKQVVGVRAMQTLQFVVVADAVDDNGLWPRRCWPNALRHAGNGGRLPVASVDSILQVPLESIYASGLTHVNRELQLVVDVEAGQRRVTLNHMTACDFGALWLKHNGATAAEAIAAAARWSHSHLALTADDCTPPAGGAVRLAYGVQRVPGVRHLPPGMHEITLVAAPCGAGKSYLAFDTLARSAKALVVAPRKALTGELAQRIRRYFHDTLRGANKRVVFYRDVSHAERSRLDCDVLVVTPESLPQFTAVAGAHNGYTFNADTVVIDELCTVVKTVFSSVTTDKTRRDIERSLLAAIAMSHTCLAIDRDIGAVEKMFVGAALAYMPMLQWRPVAGDPLSGVVPRVHVHSIVLADWVRTTVEIHESMECMLVWLRMALVAGERAAVFCASSIDAYALREMFEKADGVRCKLIAGSVDEEEKAQFAARPDRVLRDVDAQLWIYTTTANVGISVEQHPFDHVFVVLGAHLTLRDALQAERRVRHVQGQQRGERMFHLCLGDVRSSMHALRSMPTVGDAVACEQAKVQSAEWMRRNQAAVHQFNVNGAVELHEHMHTVMQIAVQATSGFECAVQFTILQHWLSDCGVTVRYVHDSDVPDDQLAEMRLALKECREDGKEARDNADTLDVDNNDAETQRLKRARGASILPIGRDNELCDELLARAEFVRWQKQFGVPCCRVWRGLLLGAPAAVREEIRESMNDNIDNGMPGGGATASSVLARACLQLIGAECIVDGVPFRREFMYTEADVVSPFDSDKMRTISADQFFEKLANAGSPTRSTQAMFTGTGKLLRHCKAFRDRDDDDDKREKCRVKACKQLAQALLGGASVWLQPDRPRWCTAQWLSNESVAHAINVDDDAWAEEAVDDDDDEEDEE
jgi:hypothetical protein